MTKKNRELNQGGPAFWRRAMDYAGEPPPEEQMSRLTKGEALKQESHSRRAQVQGHLVETHAPPPIKSRKSSQSVSPRSATQGQPSTQENALQSALAFDTLQDVSVSRTSTQRQSVLQGSGSAATVFARKHMFRFKWPLQGHKRRR